MGWSTYKLLCALGTLRAHCSWDGRGMCKPLCALGMLVGRLSLLSIGHPCCLRSPLLDAQKQCIPPLPAINCRKVMKLGAYADRIKDMERVMKEVAQGTATGGSQWTC